MEIIILAAVISVGFNIWLVRRNQVLADRVDGLIQEMAEMEYGPV